MSIVTQPTDKRATLIAGLRELADFIEAEPGLPFNLGVEIGYCVLGDDDEVGLAELEEIAAILDRPVTRAEIGHPGVSRRFGDVVYRAYHVMSNDWREFNDEQETIGKIRAGKVKVVPVEPSLAEVAGSVS